MKNVDLTQLQEVIMREVAGDKHLFYIFPVAYNSTHWVALTSEGQDVTRTKWDSSFLFYRTPVILPFSCAWLLLTLLLPKLCRAASMENRLDSIRRSK